MVDAQVTFVICSQGWQTTHNGFSTPLSPKNLTTLVPSPPPSTTLVAKQQHKVPQSLVAIRASATRAPENGRSHDTAKIVELRWLKYFEEPSMWWDNRKRKRNSKDPDFVHAATGEALSIDSCFCPKWVQSELNSLQGSSLAPGRGLRAHYRKIADASFRSGSTILVSGRAENAVRKTLPERNELSWTKRISEHTKCGQGREALRIYKDMREEGVTPKTYTFVAALKACSSVADLEAGKEIHAHVIESGVQSDIYVASTLVDMYAKCGNMVDARQVFEKMQYRNVVSWSAIIMGYAQNEAGGLALQLYARMQHEGFTPDAHTFVAVLKACSSLAEQGEGNQVHGEFVKMECLENGRAIHSQVAKSGFESHIFVANTLVDMYAKCGSMVDACWVFEKMPHRDVVSWNAMIMGYAHSEEGDLALQLYTRMHHEGFTPNTRTFVAALKACSSLAAEEGKQVNGELMKIGCLEKGRAIHSQVAKSGFESDIFVATTLVDMYAKCGNMVDALQVFEKMQYRNLVSWNAIIMGYAQNEAGELALQLYTRMQHEGFTPDACTFAAALKACGSLAAQEEGKQVDGELVKVGCLVKGRAIHSQVAKSAFESDLFVANSLVDMYAKCGSMVDACYVFEKMPHHNVVSWNAMIVGYAQIEKPELALQFYARMQHKDFTPNIRTFVAALKACGSLAAQEAGEHVNGELVKIGCLAKGRAIHSQVAKSGFESDIFVSSTLVDMYAKCGDMVNARQVFEKMQCRNVVAWNAIIMGYAQGEAGDLALQLYVRMQREGFAPDARTFVAALKACSSLAAEGGKQVDGEFVKRGCLAKGRAIHSQVKKSGLESDIFVANSLVDMYAKCGSIVDACFVFEKIPHRDVVSWTAMIMGYAQSEEGELALQLYARMQHEGFTPNARTFVAALKACGGLAAQEEGKQVNGELMKIRCLEKGRAIHSQATKSGFDSDIFVANTLVDMYAKCGSMVDACWVFERMPHHDVVSWNAMILGYAQRGKGELALQLYARMQHEGFTPNARTFVPALMACGTLAALESGKEVHAGISRVGLEGDAFVATCLVDMYGKCGSMVDAQQLFDALPARDVVRWSALISGYSRQGDSERVFDLVDRMQQEGIQPNGTTFVSVLTVCSHTGLVDKGQKYFQAMCSDYGTTPASEHYNCMVDLLGRAGELNEAVALVKKMPFKPDMTTWMTILGACRKWNNVKVGRLAFECALRLDKKQTAAYVLMTNIYEAAHMQEESAKIQAMRNNARAWKNPGQCWWTDSAGIVHTFLVGDRNHPQSKDIYAKLKDLFVKMEEEGYVPDLDSVVHNISDDEKEDVLCGHSEKLAIACALINTPPGTAIRIVKNLRVCDDCHIVTALISRIEQRDIICRDASRFHVYTDGKCSCGNFW